MFVCDHIGLVTHSLPLACELVTALTTFQSVGPTIEDKHQGVFIRFVTDPRIGFPRLELLEPISTQSPVWRKASEGGGVHHLCFQVLRLDNYERVVCDSGFTAVSSPAEAPAFGSGRRVAFVHAPGAGLLEFVETPDAPRFETIAHLPLKELKKSFLRMLRSS
jgi:hypothetical protein